MSLIESPTTQETVLCMLVDIANGALQVVLKFCHIFSVK